MEHQPSRPGEAYRRRTRTGVLRSIFVVALFVLGILTATTHVGLRATEFLYLNDPLNHAGGYLFENGHRTLFDLQQRWLRTFGFVHQAFVIGLLLGLLFGVRRSMLVIVFWIGFAIGTTYAIFSTHTSWIDALAWAPMHWCYVPAFALGVLAPATLTRPRLPRFSLMDALIAITAIALSFFFIQNSVDWGLRALGLVVMVVVASRAYNSVNHEMHGRTGFVYHGLLALPSHVPRDS